jgi:hypothetical protein
MAKQLSALAVRPGCSAAPLLRPRPRERGRAPKAFTIAIALCLLLLGLRARAEDCSSVCADPDSVEACGSGDAVWALQQPDGECRSGSHGYFDSAEAAETERRSLARLERRSCDLTGECALFEQLDGAQPVCTACDRAYRLTQMLLGLSPASESAAAATPQPTPDRRAASRVAAADDRARASPPDATADPASPGPVSCPREEWQQTSYPGRAERCYDGFTELPKAYSRGARCKSGDCQEGQGSYVWPDGQRYAGAFNHGRRHGQGTFSWPDGRKYIGGWHSGQPSGLGTRIYTDSSFLVGYFENGVYLGDSEQYGERFGERRRAAGSEGDAPEAGLASSPPAVEEGPACEEQCNEFAELELSRIIDEYECCYARHAFCVHKTKIEAESCDTAACLEHQAERRQECDLRYACDEVRDSKQVGFRERSLACLKGCAAQDLDEQGLKVSERGTLYTD